jgi:sec-independent protein translocase protein TatA
MLPQMGLPEWIIILVIVLIVFGASRLRGIGQGLGGAINAFRREVKEGREQDAQEPTSSKEPPGSQEPKAPPQVNQEEDETEEEA